MSALVNTHTLTLKTIKAQLGLIIYTISKFCLLLVYRDTLIVSVTTDTEEEVFFFTKNLKFLSFMLLLQLS